MTVNYGNCWTKLQKCLPNLNWSRLQEDENVTEYVVNNDEHEKMRLKFGRTKNGISCKILVLQDRVNQVLPFLSSLALKTELSFFNGGNTRKVSNVCNKSQEAKTGKGKPLHIGFIDSISGREQIIPFDDEEQFNKNVKNRVKILTDFIQIFVDEYENNISSQSDNGNESTPKGTSNNLPETNTKEAEENNSKPSSQPTDIDPRQWKLSKEIENIWDYSVKENIQKIYEIGEYEIAYHENENTPKYYLTMKAGRPCLSRQNEHRHILKQIVSWPMCGKGKEKYDHIKGINGKTNPVPYKIEYGTVVDSENHPHAFSFPDGSRIANPVLHPQFVFLGENWSESGDNATLKEDTSWMNGYCEQAEVVRDSKLSGGYFTDFIKFYLATRFTGKNKSDLYSNNVRLDDGTVFKNSKGKSITWFEVYVNIFKQELELLEKMFQKPEYIIIWGSSLYTLLDDISMKVYKKRFGKLFSGYKVRVFGCHYSKSGNGHTFPLDKPSDNKELLSRRRVYEVTEKYDKSAMIDDRRKGHDHRRYDFALLEDKDGHLHAYKGNSTAK